MVQYLANRGCEVAELIRGLQDLINEEEGMWD